MTLDRLALGAALALIAAAVVRANWQEVAVWDIATMAELERWVAV